MDKVKVSVHDVAVSDVCILMLNCDDYPDKLLPVIIGEYEAVCLNNLITNVITPRPMPYDLFYSLIEFTKTTINQIIIHKFSEGVFYAKIEVKNGDESLNLDTRISDATAISIVSNTPMYIKRSIFENLSASKHVFESHNDIDEDEQTKIYPIEKLSIEDLERLLNDAINSEEYEVAEMLKNILIARKKT